MNDGTVVGPRMMVAGAYVTVASGAGEATGAVLTRGLPAIMVGFSSSEGCPMDRCLNVPA